MPPLPAGEGWGEGSVRGAGAMPPLQSDGVGGMFEGIGVGVGRGNSPPIGVAVGRPYGSRTGWLVEPVPVTFTPPGPGPEPDTDVGPELWQEMNARIAAAAQGGLRMLPSLSPRYTSDKLGRRQTGKAPAFGAGISRFES